MRFEFGYPRTECNCADCTINCEFIPGFLVPADLERLHKRIAPEQKLFSFAKQYLRASPGATILEARGFNQHGLVAELVQIPTLVPARKSDGSCVFLDEDKSCSIHEVAPYGCAFFDSHQSHAMSNEKSLRALQVIRETEPTSQYKQLWNRLHERGLTTPRPEVSRERMAEELKRRAADGK